MILSDRMEGFLDSLDSGLTPELATLENRCLEAGLPVIRLQTQQLLRVLLQIREPRRLLEIGTCAGFSALLMCRYGPAGMKIVSIEQDAERLSLARQNLRAAKVLEQITLLEGDAGRLLPALRDPFDMIFLDAAKGQYIHWLPELIRLMGPGSILVSDNVLQEGNLLESHYLVERRDRTIYQRMRGYLYAVTHDTCLETIVLPVGDGVSLSVRKSQTLS